MTNLNDVKLNDKVRFQIGPKTPVHEMIVTRIENDRVFLGTSHSSIHFSKSETFHNVHIDITGCDNIELDNRFKGSKNLFTLSQKCGDINELGRVVKQSFIFTRDQLTELEQSFFDGIYD